jgi:hypothetical protein
LFLVAFSAQKGVHPLTATKGYASGLKCGSPVGCGEPLFWFRGRARWKKSMSYFWRNNSMPVKVFAIIMAGAMVYLFFVDGESFAGWTIFFISLALTILLKTIEEQDKEIQELRSSKKVHYESKSNQDKKL